MPHVAKVSSVSLPTPIELFLASGSREYQLGSQHDANLAEYTQTVLGRLEHINDTLLGSSQWE
jgi:hypothetical protein